MDSPQKKKRDCIRDLWPFAQSKAFYTKVFQAIPCKEPCEHLIVLTRSAHCAPLLAAHDLGRKGVLIVLSQSAHACAHGQAILKDNLKNHYRKKELAKVDPSRKRVLLDDLRYLRVSGPENQVTTFYDVQPDPATSHWRAGVDLSVEPLEFEKAVVRLCEKQLVDTQSAKPSVIWSCLLWQSPRNLGFRCVGPPKMDRKW